MKKFNILLMGVMALGFVACDEPAPTVPPVQSNPQGPIMESTSMAGTANGAFGTSGLLNLNDYVSNPNVPVITLNPIADMPEGGSLLARLEVANNKDFNGSQVLEMTMIDNQAYVNANELSAVHIDLFGKAPKERTVYYRIPGYIVVNGTDFRIGGMDKYVATGSYKEICIDAGYVVEDAYYFMSNATSWEFDNLTSYAFNHNGEDVYANPVFTFVVEVTNPDCYWKIAPQSAVDNPDWGKVYGVATNGDDATEGTLIVGADGAGRIPAVGKYQITINMETSKYVIKEILFPDMLSTPGVYNGWSGANASWLRISKGEEGKYAEAVMLDSQFKFTDAATGNQWVDKTTWGQIDNLLVNGGGDNIPVPGDKGAYWAYVDLGSLTYTLTKIESIGVVGALNSWSADSPIELTPNGDGSIWSGDVNLTGDWKIIINHSWGSNYGGSTEEPWFDWGNISGYEGAYVVTFDLTGNLPVIQVVPK